MDNKSLSSIVDKVKNSTSILVAVSSSPSVDALSAAIGLTIMLNALGKHVTAIFSGTVPPAITFLDPTSTFENNVDSLRDFIIALDKDKADHLRYKVDGDVVKIFITPYRTTINVDDLQFSQGDYNVELVLALGVSDQAHLDTALEAHGQIFHDATVATIGLEPSSLGSIDWQNPQASSLSEMVADLADAMKGDTSLIDNEVATALLTGVVAATDRFSNPRTSSRSMTLSAQLMAAGADQQLIAAKLQADHTINTPIATAPTETASTPGANDFAIVHDKSATLADIEKVVKAEEASSESKMAPASVTITPPASAPSSEPPAPTEPVEPAESVEPTTPTEPLPDVTENDVPTSPVVLADAYKIDPSEPALEEPTHGYLGEAPAGVPPMSGATVSDTTDTAPVADTSATSVTIMPPVAGDPAAASSALADAHAAAGTTPAPVTPPFGLPQPPPLPDFSSMMPGSAPAAPVLPTPAVTPPERLGDILAPDQAAPAPAAPVQPAASDPGQFQIPGSSV